MIIALLGGIGSGKTLSVVREIIHSNSYALTNFRLKNIKDYKRIRYSDVIREIDDGKKKKFLVNWDFWENMKKKNEYFSIYLDEVHNLIHSRRSMSQTNIQMSKWISQIRKILSDHPRNHLYIISQTRRKIDIDWRELVQIVIHCEKIEAKNKVFIKQRIYAGMDSFELQGRHKKRVFLGNPYFKYYNTNEMVTFSDNEEYI